MAETRYLSVLDVEALHVFILSRVNGWLFMGGPLEMAEQLAAVATRGGNVDEATARFTAWLQKAAVRGTV